MTNSSRLQEKVCHGLASNRYLANGMKNITESVSDVVDRLEAIDNLNTFFVAGFLKSGTTWLERIMDSHPQIICKGEAHFGSLLEPAIRQTVSVYNARIPKKGNWSKLSAELPDSFANVEYMINDEERLMLLSESIKLMLSKWAGEKQASWIGDKTPNNLEHVGLLRQILPNSKFIYIVRDVRDIAVSGWFFNLNINESQFLELYSDINNYAVTISKKWLQQVSKSYTTRLVLKDDFLQVRYEDLLVNTESVIEELFSFLGAEYTHEIVSNVKAQNEFKQLSGGREAGDENRRSFYRKGVAGDWENYLSTEAVETINRDCGLLLERLGYSL